MTTGSEYERVEFPLIEQLKRYNWQHIAPSRSGPPAVTDRNSFREVFMLDRLRAALKRINLDNQGREWLDDERIEQMVSALTRPQASRLLEINEELTQLLLLGTQVNGVVGWDGGRVRTVRFIDWERPERNDFLVINQFRVDPPGAGKSIYPDAVLFVNGIPLVVVECKAPEKVDGVGEAIEQLRRYANQRGAVDPEGAERLFHTNQLVIATTRDVAKAGTFTSLPEHFAEWKTTHPAPEDDVAAELGLAALNSQQRLVAGMLRPERLLEIVRHFTVFMQTDSGRRVKTVARYQQYRAVGRTLDRLIHGKTRPEDGEHDRRGGIIWHTQGSGKSLTMVFLIRAMRDHPALTVFKVVVITDRTQLQEQLAKTTELTGETVLAATSVRKVQQLLATPGKSLVFAMIQKYRNPEARKADDLAAKSIGVLDASTDVVVIVDEAHRTQSSVLHAVMQRALPNAARIGFTGTPIIMGDKTKTHKIFGEYIDQYRIKESEQDGATVKIFYEGRTTKAGIRDADDIDEFINLWGLTPEETEQLKRRYATKRDIAESEQLIAAKAANMLRHYVSTILPNGFKAQVVATSRRAAVRYRTAFQLARHALIAELDALDPQWKAADAIDRAGSLPRKKAELVRAWPYRDLIATLDFVPVISGAENDAAELTKWSGDPEQAIKAFKQDLPDPAKDSMHTSPIAMLLVNAMLLTGFDAPIEQVLYLDRPLKEADLLQAIARVNRTAPGKTAGYVVDYYGVAQHLTEALEAYAADDIDGTLASINDELPRLAAHHARLQQLFPGVNDFTTVAAQDECVERLADERLRAGFETAMKAFTRSLEIILPSDKALPYVDPAKAFGTIALLARRRYRDHVLFDVRVYGAKVRAVIDAHVEALSISQKIPPVSITSKEYAETVAGMGSDRTKASEMEHAIRHHISEHFDSDPVHYERLSEHLERILVEMKDQWEQLALALADFRIEVIAGRGGGATGFDSTVEAAFYDLLKRILAEQDGKQTSRAADGALRAATHDVVEQIKASVRLVGFWDNHIKRDQLRRKIIHRLDETRLDDGSDLFAYEWLAAFADRLLELARANHTQLAAMP